MTVYWRPDPVGAIALKPISASAPTWKRIAHECARKHGVRPDELLGNRRWRYLMPARQELYYRLLAELEGSAYQVAFYIDRNQSTLLAGAAKHAARHGLDTGPIDRLRRAPLLSQAQRDANKRAQRHAREARMSPAERAAMLEARRIRRRATKAANKAAGQVGAMA